MESERPKESHNKKMIRGHSARLTCIHSTTRNICDWLKLDTELETPEYVNTKIGFYDSNELKQII